MPARRPQLWRNKAAASLAYTPYALAGTPSPLCAQALVDRPERVPLISIVTCSAHPQVLLACAAALQRHTDYPRYEWLVGAWGAAASLALPACAQPTHVLRVADAAAAPGHVRQALVAQAQGKYLLLLDAMLLLQPFCLTRLMLALRHLARREVRPVGLVAARIDDGRGRPLDAGRQAGDAAGMWAMRQGSTAELSEDAFCPAVSLRCALVQRDLYVALGGMRATLAENVAAIDFCQRLQAEGYGVLQSTGARCRLQPGQRRPKDWAPLQAGARLPTTCAQAQICAVDVSVVTCVNNLSQYLSHVVGSLLRSYCRLNVEILPVDNFANRFSAAQALNLGLGQARGPLVVLCHQDVIFLQCWLELLRLRVGAIGQVPWGVLGTAGVTARGERVGLVHKLTGSVDWHMSPPQAVAPVQTLDEHCLVVRRHSGLRFDARTLPGFHLYGADLCLTALAHNMPNYGMVNPLIHNGTGGSTHDGEQVYLRAWGRLQRKWQQTFPLIVTPSAALLDGKVHSCLRF